MKNLSIPKRKNFILTISALFFVFAESAYGAACDPMMPTFCNPLNLSGGKGVQTIGDAIVIAIKFLLSFIGIFSLLFIIIAGIKYVTSTGNPDNIKKAKHTFVSAITGLVLALVSYGIIKALEKILTVQ